MIVIRSSAACDLDDALVHWFPCIGRSCATKPASKTTRHEQTNRHPAHHQPKTTTLASRTHHYAVTFCSDLQSDSGVSSVSASVSVSVWSCLCHLCGKGFGFHCFGLWFEARVCESATRAGAYRYRPLTRGNSLEREREK